MNLIKRINRKIFIKIVRFLKYHYEIYYNLVYIIQIICSLIGHHYTKYYSPDIPKLKGVPPCNKFFLEKYDYAIKYCRRCGDYRLEFWGKRRQYESN